MQRKQFLSKLRTFCRQSNIDLCIFPAKGKGSHAQVRVGGKLTTVKAGELNPQYIQLLLRQLGLPRDALK